MAAYGDLAATRTDRERLDQLAGDAVDRAVDRRTPAQVVYDAAPDIARARERVLMDFVPSTPEEVEELEREQANAASRVVRMALLTAGYDPDDRELQGIEEVLDRGDRPTVGTIVHETMFARVRDGAMAPTPALAHAHTFTGSLDDFDPEDVEAGEDAAGRWRSEMYDAVYDAVREAGYDPDDMGIDIEIGEFFDIAEVELEGAEKYSFHKDLHDDGYMTDAEWARYRDDEIYVRDYRDVYEPESPPCPLTRIRPPVRLHAHGARHRRAPGRRPVRRHGSRRAAGVRSGQDPGDDGDPPVDPAPPGRADVGGQLRLPGLLIGLPGAADRPVERRRAA
jgi:hypothetical protein